MAISISTGADCDIANQYHDWSTIQNNLLPAGYSYDIVKSLLPQSIEFRANIRTEETLKGWLSEFKNNVHWVVRRTNPKRGYLYQADLTCCHGTNRERKVKHFANTKNTGCPAKLRLKLKVIEKTSLQKPLICTLYPSHNHVTDNASALGKNRVSLRTRSSLAKMFEDGLTPAQAARKIKEPHAQQPRLLADRSINPDYKFINHMFNTLRQKDYGKYYYESPELLQSLERKLSSIKGVKYRGGLTSHQEVVVAFLSPIMIRAHNTRQSGEICFMDTSGGMDGNDMRLLLLITNSNAGGVPLGAVIVNSECREAVAMGLSFLKQLLGPEAFGRRGSCGPVIFMTDDSAAERAAISEVFPSSHKLLCTFHVLQSVQRWLRKKKFKESMDECYTLFRSLLYCSSPERLTEIYNKAAEVWIMHPAFKIYVDSFYWNRCQDWALAYRMNLPTGGSNTNNFVETQFKVMKDTVLERARAFNSAHLIDFVCVGYEQHIMSKLLDVAHHRKPLTSSITTISAEDAQQQRHALYQLATGSEPSPQWCLPLHITAAKCSQQAEHCSEPRADDVAMGNEITQNKSSERGPSLDVMIGRIKDDVDGDPDRLMEPFRYFFEKWLKCSSMKRATLLRGGSLSNKRNRKLIRVSSLSVARRKSSRKTEKKRNNKL